MASWKLCAFLLICVFVVLVSESEARRGGRRRNSQNVQGEGEEAGEDGQGVTHQGRGRGGRGRGRPNRPAGTGGRRQQGGRRPGRRPGAGARPGARPGGRPGGRPNRTGRPGRPGRGGRRPRPAQRPTEEQVAQLLESLSGSINSFSLKVHREMMKPDINTDNFVFSPFSVYNAMSMALMGAAGGTKREIYRGMGIPTGVHQALNLYNTSLAMAGSENATLSMANAIYVKQGESSNLNQRFRTKVQMMYRTAVQELLTDNPEEPINQWVKQMTGGEIEDFLEDGSIGDDTIMLLVNAIYFKGKWKNAFDDEETQTAQFKVSGDESVDVDMMYIKDNFRVHDSSILNAQILELPYKGERYAMNIILPKTTTNLADVTARLTADTLDDVASALEGEGPSKWEVKMPKFALDTAQSMKDILKKLGINQAFDNRAKFKKMTSTSVMISDVSHRAVIEVDEEGTVAAAATGLEMVLTSVVFNPQTITVDRPFMFIIRDMEQNVNLFMGQFVDPEGDNLAM